MVQKSDKNEKEAVVGFHTRRTNIDDDGDDFLKRRQVQHFIVIFAKKRT